MQLIELRENVWLIQGGSNIGVIAYEDHCLIIDSGMDKDTGQNILKQVRKLGLIPTALLITHAHADHFGGADYLVRQTGLQVYATRVEASVMSGPILEPLYLFGGAQPPKELLHKFFLAKPCKVDVILEGNELEVDHIPLKVIALPGHSSEQIGIAFEDILFVGDAFLTPQILDKHRIPFYTDIPAGLKTLRFLKTLLQNPDLSDLNPFPSTSEGSPNSKFTPFKLVVAGHGEIYNSTDQVNQVIDYSVQRLENILAQVGNALDYGEPRSTSDVLSFVAAKHGASITSISQHSLYNTTIQAALSALYTQNVIQPIFLDNRLLWLRAQ
jgi:glyoxylase-like metal-dependent hydrolase (beta-lactamase superfamily II)